jgi:hypothetical protein
MIALRPTPLERKLEQVREGMTYDEVVEIMGKPDIVERNPIIMHLLTLGWESRRGAAWVNFESEVVTSTEYDPIEPTGFLDRVLAWLGL